MVSWQRGIFKSEPTFTRAIAFLPGNPFALSLSKCSACGRMIQRNVFFSFLLRILPGKDSPETGSAEVIGSCSFLPDPGYRDLHAGQAVPSRKRRGRMEGVRSGVGRSLDSFERAPGVDLHVPRRMAGWREAKGHLRAHESWTFGEAQGFDDRVESRLGKMGSSEQ